MKKLLLLMLVSLLALTACQTAAPAATEEPPTPTLEPLSNYPLTVTDGAGNRVTLEAEPMRIVSLAPSHTEILFALGLGDRVVGVTEYCNYPPEATALPQVGGFSSIDLEQVVGLDPDLVLGTTLHATEIAPALQEREVTVFIAEPQTVLEVMDTVLTIGHLAGVDDAAADLAASMQARIDAVQETIADAEQPTVFWELGPELYSAGPGSFINDLIVMAGGENIAADADSPWPQMSMEAIILKDPDVVVLADHNYGQTSEMVKERPGWTDIAAVKEGRIIEITDDDIISRPGPRVVDGLEFIAKALHPDLFE